MSRNIGRFKRSFRQIHEGSGPIVLLLIQKSIMAASVVGLSSIDNILTINYFRLSKV
jgi:hypothetical protein